MTTFVSPHFLLSPLPSLGNNNKNTKRTMTGKSKEERGHTKRRMTGKAKEERGHTPINLVRKRTMTGKAKEERGHTPINPRMRLL